MPKPEEDPLGAGVTSACEVANVALEPKCSEPLNRLSSLSSLAVWCLKTAFLIGLELTK